MNIEESITYGIKHLEALAEPRLEAEVLLCWVLAVDRVFLRTHNKDVVGESHLLLYKKCIQKRSLFVPLAYITGTKEWSGMELKVNEWVLIPRDETEVLCQHIIAAEEREGLLRILEVGTGSGAIALGLARGFELKERATDIVALDISKEALLVAAQNREIYKPNRSNIELVESDLLFALSPGWSCDLIVANLPYVPQCMELAPDLSYEPDLALFAEDDGLELIKRLRDEIKDKNIVFKSLWLEFLPSQKEAIAKLFSDYEVRFLGAVGADTFFAEITQNDGHTLPRKFQ